LANFQSCGSVPEKKDLLNNLVRDGANWEAHSFRIRGEIVSGPGDLWGTLAYLGVPYPILGYLRVPYSTLAYLRVP
jgi:hypothetical protein